MFFFILTFYINRFLRKYIFAYLFSVHNITNILLLSVSDDATFRETLLASSENVNNYVTHF